MINNLNNLDELINSSPIWRISNYLNKELPPKSKWNLFNTKKEYRGHLESIHTYFKRMIDDADEVKEGGGHIIVYYGSIIIDFVEKESTTPNCRSFLYRNWYEQKQFDEESSLLGLKTILRPRTIRISD